MDQKWTLQLPQHWNHNKKLADLDITDSIFLPVMHGTSIYLFQDDGIDENLKCLYSFLTAIKMKNSRLKTKKSSNFECSNARSCHSAVSPLRLTVDLMLKTLTSALGKWLRISWKTVCCCQPDYLKSLVFRRCFLADYYCSCLPLKRRWNPRVLWCRCPDAGVWETDL